MQDLTITLVQANQRWEDKEANLSNYDQLLKNVSNTDLIVLPEMFHTGFSMKTEKLAETMNNSMGISWLKHTAYSKKTAIYTSLIIKERNCFFNRGVFVEPSGKISVYDKRKCFGLAGEDKFFNAGNQESIVSYKHWKFQLQICYDLRFPEIVRNRITANDEAAYDVILYIANWPERRNIHWKTLLKARAIENQSYVVGVNRVGIDGSQLSYSGDSAVIDALGYENTLSEGIEEFKSIIISKQNLDDVRATLPFLKDIDKA